MPGPSFDNSSLVLKRFSRVNIHSFIQLSLKKFYHEGNQEVLPSHQDDNQVKNEIRLFEAADEENIEIPDKEENFELPLVDCCRTGYFFEQAGIGFGQEETFRIFLALKSLAMECTFVSVRFWGKIFGVKANYYIVEAEYREGMCLSTNPGFFNYL